MTSSASLKSCFTASVGLAAPRTRGRRAAVPVADPFLPDELTPAELFDWSRFCWAKTKAGSKRAKVSSAISASECLFFTKKPHQCSSNVDLKGWGAKKSDRNLLTTRNVNGCALYEQGCAAILRCAL